MTRQSKGKSRSYVPRFMSGSNSSPGSPASSPGSPASPPIEQKSEGHTALAIGIGIFALILFTFIIIAVITAPAPIVDDSPNSTANWCLERSVREVVPNDYEVSMNYSRVARFFEQPKFAVNSFVHLEVTWNDAYSWLKYEPYLAFVLAGPGSSFAFIVDPKRKEFKTLNVDASPLRFMAQIKERQHRLKGEVRIPMKNTTSGPFKIAVSLKIDYKHNVLTLEFYADTDGMAQDRRLLTKRYEVAPFRPQPMMTPVVYVANGVMKNNTNPGKPKISYQNIGCNVHQRDNMEGKAVYKQICRSRVPRRYYVCALGEKKPEAG